MKALLEFLKSTLIGGLLIILPLGLVIMIAMNVVGMLKPIADPMAQILPEPLQFPLAIAMAMLIIISFAAGLLSLTQTGHLAGKFIEESILNHIPGYSMVRSLTRRISDEEYSTKFAPAIVEFDEALVLAFIIELHDDGKYTIFVPSTPTPAVGTVYVMDSYRVNHLNVPFIEAVKCVSEFGVGFSKLMSSMQQPSENVE